MFSFHFSLLEVSDIWFVSLELYLLQNEIITKKRVSLSLSLFGTGAQSKGQRRLWWWVGGGKGKKRRVSAAAAAAAVVSLLPRYFPSLSLFNSVPFNSLF